MQIFRVQGLFVVTVTVAVTEAAMCSECPWGPGCPGLQKAHTICSQFRHFSFVAATGLENNPATC